jgi:hypothetical protein
MNGFENDSDLCFRMAIWTIGSVLEDSKKVEVEYNNFPERFEDITSYDKENPFVQISDASRPPLAIDGVISCFDFIENIRQAKDDENISMPANWYDIAMTLDDLMDVGVFVLPNRKIAVKKTNGKKC